MQLKLGVKVSALLLAGAAAFSIRVAAAEYHGQVLYRDTRRPLANVTVQAVNFAGVGASSTRILANTTTDAQGHFQITLPGSGRRKDVSLIATASGGTSGPATIGGGGFTMTSFTGVLAISTHASSAGENILLANHPRRRNARPRASENR